MRQWLLASLLFAVGMPSAAIAATQATVEAGARTITVAFEGSNARVDVSGIPQAYFLLRDGQVYPVVQLNGRPMTVDANAAAGLLGNLVPAPSGGMIASLDSLTPTGARQTVAGQAGEVYTVKYHDHEGRIQTGQGVLGRQPQVRALTRILAQVAESLGASTQAPMQGVQSVARTLEERGLGVLSYGTEFQVVALGQTRLPDGYLELPGSPAGLPAELGQWLKRLPAR